MYKVALVLSAVIWAVVIAVILSTPADVRRTVQMLRDTRGKTTPTFSSIPRLSVSGANTRLVQEAGDLADYEVFIIGSDAADAKAVDLTAAFEPSRSAGSRWPPIRAAIDFSGWPS